MSAARSATIPEQPTLPSSGNSPAVDKAAGHNRTAHIVTMSKGGVGKSLVAWNILQFLRERDRKVTGIDLDPMTHSLAEWKGLGVREVNLLTGPDAAFNGAAMDALAEDMITAGPGENFVLDNGAAGFVGLTRYLCDNEFPALLKGYDGRLVVHAVLGGGTAAGQCLVGLHTLLEAFGARSGVQFVLWVNEHAGPFRVDGMFLEDMAIYKDMLKDDRVIGVVRLERLKAAFLLDFDRMREDRLTYGEAIASPKFLVMNKQRLTVIRRGIWEQLDALGLGS